jgi:ASC-1-like (ASCH) protein
MTKNMSMSARGGSALGRKIEKKCWPEYFKKILAGEKKFELRLADWQCQPGDTLVLREWDPETKEYTGRQIEKEVTDIIKTKEIKFFSKADAKKYGYQIISLK